MATQVDRIKGSVKKGGFLPSVAGGLSAAGYLTPMAVRQAYRLWNDKSLGKVRKTRRQRRGTKKAMAQRRKTHRQSR